MFRARTLLTLSAVLLVGCLASSPVEAPAPPNVDGALIALMCSDARARDLRPALLWLPSDSSTGQSVEVILTKPPQQPCTVTSTGLEDQSVGLDSVSIHGDTLLRIHLRPVSLARTKIYVSLNGSILSLVDILVSSRGFRNTAIGHRGAGIRYPENTIVALHAAASAGLAGSEVDVRLTQDTVAILMHDETVNRTTTGTGNVQQLTAAQVLALDAGVKISPMFAGQRVPTLAQALAATASSGQYLYVEGKAQTIIPMAQFAQMIVQQVKDAGAENRVTLTSSSTDFLRAARNASGVIGLALQDRSYRSWHKSFCTQIQATAILYFEPDSLTLPSVISRLDSISAQGVQIIASTTNRPSLADSLLATSPVRWILTDYPPGVYGLGKLLPPDSLP